LISLFQDLYSMLERPN